MMVIRQHWRIVVFAVLLLAFGSLGFVFHNLAAPPEFDMGTTKNPSTGNLGPIFSQTLELAAYVESGHAATSFTADLLVQPGDQAVLTIRSPVQVVVLASNQDAGHQMVPIAGTNEVFGILLEPNLTDSYPTSVSWNLKRADAVQNKKGSLVTDLPRFVSDATSDVRGTSGLLTVANNRGNPGTDVICTSPQARTFGVLTSRIPQPPDCSTAITNFIAFDKPKAMQSSITLLGVGTQLNNSRIDVSTPPGGAVVDDNYRWTGSDTLAPYLNATEFSAADSRSRDDFLSGIAFATAAAALIALLQERREKKAPAKERIATKRLPSTPAPTVPSHAKHPRHGEKS